MGLSTPLDLVERGVPAVSGPGNLCLLMPAVLHRGGWGGLQSPRPGLSPEVGRPVWSAGRAHSHMDLSCSAHSCEVSCPQGTAGTFCPSTPPCHNGGVFQASQGSCSCPPGWMV